MSLIHSSVSIDHFISNIELTIFDQIFPVFSSSLFKWAVFRSILFPNSVRKIFITMFWILWWILNFYFMTFSGVFSCSFSWVWFLFLILCLYEFRWNSYLLWSWRGVLMWEHPCVDSLSSVPLVGGPHLMRTPITSFPRGLAAVTLVEGAGDGGAAHCGGGRWDSAHHQSVRGRGWSWLAGAEALSLQLELPLIPLSLWFSFSRLPGRFPWERGFQKQGPMHFQRASILPR